MTVPCINYDTGKQPQYRGVFRCLFVMRERYYGIYSALQVNFSEENYEDNENTLETILSSIEPLNIKKYNQSDVQHVFVQPTYNQNNKVKTGPLSFILPDGFEYVTTDHVPQNDNKAMNALDDYTMIAAPADCNGGLRNYRDASLGINISKPTLSGVTEAFWEKPDVIKEGLNSNKEGRKVKFIKEGPSYLIAYGKGNECEDGTEPYWVSYFIIVLCGILQYTYNLYFNFQKAGDAEYIEAVESFCSKIQVNVDDIEEAQANNLCEELGDMAAPNGKLNAVLASRLYSDNIFFNNDDEVIYDGTHTVISGFQLNATVLNKYPDIVKKAGVIVQELHHIVTFVDENKNLMIPKSLFHPNILNATRNNPITGATVFEFCAWHMLMISESAENKYTVMIDKNLIYGIPDAFAFVGEFIKTLRAYNEIYEDFDVTFASAIIADGPCGNISTPVRGAVTAIANAITVKGDSKNVSDGYAAKLRAYEAVPKEDYTKNKITNLESVLSSDVILGLKAEAKDAKAVFAGISSAIKAKDYSDLADIDEVITRVDTAVDKSIDIMAFNLTYMYRPFVNSYEMAYMVRKVVSDDSFGRQIMYVLTESTFEREPFNPNAFPKRLSDQMDALTEDGIYLRFLEIASELINAGQQVISELSAEYIRKKLDELENDIEVQETQYEGRIERIENVRVGDKLILMREPDNEYDSNAIDVRASSGSLGHLSSYATKFLSPALDAGTITATAEVTKVEPLSQRSSRAKKPLLSVRIIVADNNSQQEINVASEEMLHKQQEAEAKRKEAAESGAIALAKEAIQKYKQLERDWQTRLDRHQDQVSSKTYMSMDEVVRDMQRIVRDRDRFGTKYDDLISDIDTRGKEFIDEGCSYMAVGAIRDAINEIIEESSALDINFSTEGMSTEDIGETEFSVSGTSKTIQRWWKTKYEEMPEVKTAKLKKKLSSDLEAAEKFVADAVNKRAALDEKENRLHQDIERIEGEIIKLENGFDASKSGIEAEADSRIRPLQTKIDELRSAKAAAETSIEEMQTQIAGLSFLKFGLKKELTQKVETVRAGLPKFTEDIRKLEADRDEINRKCNADIDSLRQIIRDKKRELDRRKAEYAALPDEKNRLDSNIADAEKKVADLKEQIANL